MGGDECDSESERRSLHDGLERPGVMSGLERAALFKRQEVGLEVAELKVLRCSLWVTSMEMVRNEHIGGTARAEPAGGKVRLRWFRHEGQRRDSGYFGQRMLTRELASRRKRERRQRRFMM